MLYLYSIMAFFVKFIFLFEIISKQWNNQVESEELCSICSVYTGVEVHPCRVCCKAFHELCLKKKGKLHDHTEQEAFRKANTEKGWSCHDCVSLIEKFYFFTHVNPLTPMPAVTFCDKQWPLFYLWGLLTKLGISLILKFCRTEKDFSNDTQIAMIG